MTKRAASEAGLYLIDNGFDSLYVRIWQHIDSTVLVIDIKRENNQWIANLHTINISVVEDEIVYGNTRSIFAGPKSGWTNFSKKIFNSGILDLPSDIELKNYHNTTASDASFVTVEIATKYHYRIYSYSQPGMHLQYPEAKKMTGILNFLEKKFDFKMSEKYTNNHN